jgi:hypothetical protein
MPTYSGQAHLAAAMMFGLGATDGYCDVVWGSASVSHPEHGFNMRWAEALNKRAAHGLTHFAMLHSDVVPEAYWLDKLVVELEQQQADLLSVVVPIKSPEGRTSTALFDPTGSGRIDRTLTLEEAHRLPVTFGAGQFPGKVLLVNTGCFVCRFDRDWCPKVWAKCATWVKDVAGGYEAEMFPSDWDMSLQLAKLGCKVLATRGVEVYHDRPEWTNARVWGTARGGA